VRYMCGRPGIALGGHSFAEIHFQGLVDFTIPLPQAALNSSAEIAPAHLGEAAAQTELLRILASLFERGRRECLCPKGERRPADVY
jgi:hypothetical protein